MDREKRDGKSGKGTNVGIQLIDSQRPEGTRHVEEVILFLSSSQ